MAASAPIAFGSRLAGPQFAAWHAGIRLTGRMADIALAIFVFDAIIQNDDRRDGNANCLNLGESFRIIDHELAFGHKLILGWRPPWEAGGLAALQTPGRHIFRDKLRRVALNFDQIRETWAGLSDSRIDHYAACLPAEWGAARVDAVEAIALIKSARDNIDLCLNEVRRVLT